MAMSDDDIKSALLSLINMASNQVDALHNDLVGEAIAGEAVDHLLQSLGNIRDASELSGLEEIGRLCSEKLNELTHASNSSSIDAGVLHDITSWLNELKQKLDSENKNAPLNSNYSENLGSRDAEARGAFEEESLNPVFYALKEEMEELAPEIIRLSDSISISENNSDRLSQSSGKYLEILERIKSTSDLLEMRGLGEISSLLSKNITAVAQLDKTQRSALSNILATVPAYIINYLKNPLKDENCVELLAHLSDDKWPHPLGNQEARLLLQDLVEAPTGEFNEDEELEERPLVATQEDLSLALDEDVNTDLLNAFHHEVPQLAAEFSDCVAQVVEGRDLQKNLSGAQRIAHTIKGAANLVGLKGIANLTHHLEDVLQYFSNKHLAPSLKISNILASSADCIEEMIESVQEQSAAPQDAVSLLQSVLDLANQIDKGSAEGLISKNTSDKPILDSADGSTTTNQPTKKLNSGDQASLRIAVGEIDEISRLTGELATSIDLIQGEIRDVLGRKLMARSLDASMQRRRFELETIVDIRGTASMQKRGYLSTLEQSMFDPLEMDQYDELHGATHSYFESVDDIRELTRWILKKYNDLESLLLQHQQMNKELQELVLSTRLVAVSTIVPRLKRSVRQAARATGKKVDVKIAGDDLKVDSDVLSAIADPIMHILRNAVDHGIESPEERKSSGKPVFGKIDLSFSRVGNYVVIECSDDGKGLNYSKIRETAISRGLIGGGSEAGNDELGRLILVPGFSTKEKATHISGRGVGMDIVNSSVRSLSGTLDIIENKPSGTSITIKLPIKMVAHHALLVKSETTAYAIPSDHVSQVMTPGTGWYSKDKDDLFYWFDDKAYPVKRLSNLIGESPSSRPQTPELSCYVLLVESVTDTIAVLVDEIEKNIEIAIKGLGDHIPPIQGIAGVSILGQGIIVPVLNLHELMSRPSLEVMGAVHEKFSHESADPPVLSRVLIVDDSFSVRKTLSQIVRDAGYEVDTAQDGIEAIERIRLAPPQIVIADLEMPRMNGLELTYLIRDSENTNNLPIIMLTSRSTQKHRLEAKKAGVSLYLTKPVSDEVLLTEIDALLSHHVPAASA